MKEYIGTIVVAAILAVLVGFVIYRMVRNKKRGGGCSGNCSCCGGSCPHSPK